MNSIGTGSDSLTQYLYQRMFSHLDVDKSDGLSLDELKAVGGEDHDYASAFKKLDADTDGKISRVEMTGSTVALATDTLLALLEDQTSATQKTALAPTKGTLGLLEGARSAREIQDISDLFARADVDGDGKLSDIEWEAEKALRRSSNLDAGMISGALFIAVDADRDGLTSKDEVRAGRGAPLALMASTTAPPPNPIEIDPFSDVEITTDSGAPVQQTTEQANADLAEGTSGGDGAYKFLDRELVAYRSAAQLDFSNMTMSGALSSRLFNQLLAGLDAQTEDLAKQVYS